LFFAALFLFLVGIVVGVSRASAIAAGDSNSGSEVRSAAPVASSGLVGKNPQSSDAQVKIMSNDNGSSGETGGQSNNNANPGTGEPGTNQPMINVGNMNSKFPQTGEADDSIQMLIGGIVLILTSIGLTLSIKRHVES
jgi:LPXTG-motif cell wall-anchored protein